MEMSHCCGRFDLAEHTFMEITYLLRKTGAKEILKRVSSSPIILPCFYSMDFPTREEFLVFSMIVNDIQQYMCVVTLGCLSTKWRVPDRGNTYCIAYFSDKNPTALTPEVTKSCLESDKTNARLTNPLSLRYES